MSRSVSTLRSKPPGSLGCWRNTCGTCWVRDASWAFASANCLPTASTVQPNRPIRAGESSRLHRRTDHAPAMRQKGRNRHEGPTFRAPRATGSRRPRDRRAATATRDDGVTQEAPRTALPEGPGCPGPHRFSLSTTLRKSSRVRTGALTCPPTPVRRSARGGTMRSPCPLRKPNG